MATRTYRSDELRVLWDTARCVHVAYCIQALPGVFNPLARPWVRLQNGTTDEIVAAIERCPTGALRYIRDDGGPQETPPEETTVTAVRDGPLAMRGNLRVLSPDGETIANETRLALCRCGASENAPFCDNSHRRIGFRSSERAADVHESAESPADIAPPQPEPFSPAE